MQHARYEDFTVVLPTLNEEATIGELLNYLLSHYKGIHILVMDDGSSDRTKVVVQKIGKASSSVAFVDRKAMGLQRGLTASIVHGIKMANTKYAIVMDADLQHPPEIVGRLARCLKHGSNLAIAVRAREKHWPFYRRLISKSLMGFGKLVLFFRGKQSSTDIFSGFFGVERKLFVSVYSNNRNRFVGQGYKALFDFLKCADKQSIRLCEVPYEFRLRKAGTSKAGLKQGLAVLKSFFS